MNRMGWLSIVAICLWNGSMVLAAGTDPARLPGIVVDDEQAEFQGKWTESTKVSPYIGKSYRYCAAGESGQRATFTARVPEVGSYHILLAYNSSSNRAEELPILISADGVAEKVIVNQKRSPQYARQWEPLATLDLPAGEVKVEIDVPNAKGDAVIVDALQILTDAELAEVKKNQPPVQPKLAVNAQPATKPEKKADETPSVEPVAPFVRRPSRSEKKILTTADLDALLESQVGGIVGAEQVDDVAFLRRVTFDLVGRQPRREELTSFVADASSTKREQLVDRLLASPEFGQNWANYWSDVISYRTPQPELTFLNYGPFKAWLAKQFNEGRKWDEIVYDIITAGGKVGDNPAATFVGFHQADRSRLAAETTRVFLSTQIQCAECHDHKFIDLKQETFHHVAAYFARVEAKLPWNDSQGIVVKSRGKGEHNMPGKKDEMSPAAFGSGSVELGSGDAARRMQLANWLVGADNPWFAKAFVNRTWARLMGRGFSEPVDEIGELGDHVLPEVFERVAEHYVASEFDVKRLFRTIVLSKAYQRPLRNLPRGWVKPFSLIAAGRLRGDEVFEALQVGLQLPNITPPATEPTAEIRFPPPPKSTRDLVNEVFGFDPSLAAEQVTRSMQQVMFMMNNRQVQQQINAAPDSNTLLAQLLRDSPDDDLVLAQLYERLLARAPSERERSIAREHLRNLNDRPAAFEDLLWSILNSAEFSSRR